MDIKEVMAEKANLEREILYFIQDRIAEFEEKTGVKIDDLKLIMNLVEKSGEKTRKELASFSAIIIL